MLTPLIPFVRFQAGASLVAFFAMFVLLTGTYYLPTFLQVSPEYDAYSTLLTSLWRLQRGNAIP